MASNLPLILILIVIIAVIIIFIGIGLYFRFSGGKNPTDIPQSEISYNVTLSWSQSDIEEDCDTYRYPLSSDGSPGPINPIPATLNANNIAQATLIDPVPCVDSDTLQVAGANHTCNNKPSTVADLSDSELAQLPTNCRGSDGTIYSYNQTENYFVTCPTIRYCPGFLGVVTVGFERGQEAPCLSLTPQGLFSVQTCNINLPSQQWRIIQAAPGEYPSISSSPATGGKQGIIVALMDRETNTWVVPQNVEIGSELTTTDDPPNFGFVWVLVPSLIFGLRISPPQLVYVGNLSVEQMSQISFSDPVKLADFFDQNSNYSIRKFGSQVILNKFNRGEQEDDDPDPVLFTVIFFNTLNYNFIYRDF